MDLSSKEGAELAFKAMIEYFAGPKTGEKDMKPTITIIDDLHPEDNAMLQALQSRSPASVAERLKKVRSVGSGQFMEKFYIGYGHKSIGDCGTTTIYIEGVSMLAAKAIQDTPLYSGQEASTRFMDFSATPFHNPLGTAEGERIQEGWRSFYLESMDPVKESLRERYPIKDADDPEKYAAAIGARAFDILRSFLPAGATTNLSWHTNLRQAADHLDWLIYHPDLGIRSIAKDMLSQLKTKYKGSFRDDPDHPVTQEQADYKTLAMRASFLENFKAFIGDDGPHIAFGFSQSNLSNEALAFNQSSLSKEELDILATRPKGVEVPRFLGELGNVTSSFLLDFGSYRDLQRHRAGIIRMPLLTCRFGFNRWYLNELPDPLKGKAMGLIDNQARAIKALDCDEFTAQNYCAMGFQVPCQVTQSLPALIYRLEQRSSKSVHPSFRKVILEEIRQFRSVFPDVALYVNDDPDSFTVRRGGQTIKEKS